MNLWFVCMIDLEDTDEDDLSKGEVVNGDYIYISVENLRRKSIKIFSQECLRIL
ncbi:hypothetical protein Lser_V15G08204 [Lactuca serriola]